MRIAVVDDERPARSELRHQLSELLPDAQIDEGESGAQALEMAGEVCYDLFFLDINLGDINGTVLVNALKNMQPNMKAWNKRRLEKMLKKCGMKKSEKPLDSMKRIAINTEGKTIFKEVGDIVYIETYNRGCLIHTVEEDYFEGKTIGEFEKRMCDMGFFRSQKSYLVNLNKVKELFLWKNNSFAIKMEGYEKEILPVGREKIKILRQLLGG